MRNPLTSLLSRLVNGTVSSCTCLTKSPDVLEHDPQCRYRLLTEAADVVSKADEPIPMVLYCPACGVQHIDAPNPDTGWSNPPHRSHQCQACGAIWRPADTPTVGVATIQTAGRNDSWAPGDQISAVGAKSPEGTEAAASDVASAPLQALVRQSEELFTHWLYWVSGEAGDTPPVEQTQALLSSAGEALKGKTSPSRLQEELLELREQYALRDHPEQKAELDALRAQVHAYEGELETLRETVKAQKAELDTMHRDQGRWQADEHKALSHIGKLSTELERAKREIETVKGDNVALSAQLLAVRDALVPVRTAVQAMPHWAISARAKAQLAKLCEAAERALRPRPQATEAAASPARAAEPAPVSAAASAAAPTPETAEDPSKRRRKRSRKKKTTSA